MEASIYGEFHNSLTFQMTLTEDMPTMGLAEHTGVNVDVTVLVTTWDD